MALSQTSSSRMTSDLMRLQPVILESQNAMNAVDGATIERRIRISRPDEERGRCKGSRAWDPRKDFSQSMQQPTTLSTSNVISPQQERTEPSGHRPCRRGVKSSLRREPDMPADLLCAQFGNVTVPPARSLNSISSDLGIRPIQPKLKVSKEVAISRPDYTRDLSHLVLGRWRELVPLNLREIGRADPDHLRGGNQSCGRNKRTAA